MSFRGYVFAARDLIQRHTVILMWFALAVVAVCLIYWRIVRGYIPPVSYVAWPTPPDWVRTLYEARWVVRAILFVGLGGLGYVELAYQGVSRTLRQLLSSRRSRFFLVGGMAALIGTYIFQPGNYVVAEHRPNVSAPWVLLQNWRHGEWFAYWTNYGHLGGPFMQFHNSIYYYFAALLGLLIPDFFDVAEVAAYGLVIASGWTIFLYAGEIAESYLAGVVAAVAYTGSFYMFQIYSLDANNPLGLFLVLCPLQFYLIEKTMSNSGTGSKSALLLTALVVGVQVWNHPLHGSWMVVFGVFYSAVRWLTKPGCAMGQRVKNILMVGGIHVLGVTIGLYQILPQIVEGSHVHSIEPSRGLSFEQILDPHLGTDWGGAYISWSILAVAFFACLIGLRLRHHQLYAVIVLAVLLMVLATSPRYLPGLFDFAGILPYGNLIFVRAHRYFLVAFMFISTLAGLCVVTLLRFLEQFRAGAARWMLRAWTSERLGLLLMVVILAENIPLTLWFNFKSPDAYLNDSMGRWSLIELLSQTPDKTPRVFDLREGLTPSWIYPMLTGHPSLGGNGEDAPPSFYLAAKPFQKSLLSDLERGHISSTTADLLYLLNIGYLVTDGTDTTIGGLEPLRRSDSATLWRVPNHSPITAYSAPRLDQEDSVPGDVPVIMYEHLETSTTVRIQFSVPEPAFIQLSYSSYPYLRVSLDNDLIPYETTSLGLIGFWAGEGRHVVEVRPELSPLRKITLGIGAVTFTAIIALVLVWNRTT